MSTITKTPSALQTDGASTPTDQYDHEISLVDHTRPEEEPLSPQETEAAPETPLTATSSVDPLRHLWTREGLQRELQRRKYARYQEDKVSAQDRPSAQKRPTLGADERPANAQGGSTTDSIPQTSQSVNGNSPATPRKRDTIRHHRDRVTNVVKDTVRGPRLKHTHTDAESLFDVLYENQRGAFFCGIPRFSSKSLLNFDPPAWQTHTYHPSPVNITNAQLPDPSWVWASGWNNWYVDMSYGVNEPIAAAKKGTPTARARGDTDEEGWRYSFAFGQRGRWHWHGTHPWFHSFVRRRRWVRLRVKRSHHLAPEGARVAAKAEIEGHRFNAEYFSIHNSKRPASRYTEGTAASERPSDPRYSAATSKRWSRAEVGDATEAEDIKDVPSLLKALRNAAVDREKIAAVRKFLDQGGDEIHYLAENMHEVMSLLIFQTSRQQLQSILSRRLRDAEKAKGKDRRKSKEQEPPDQAQEDRQDNIDNLRRAVEAAKHECEYLEYWSAQHTIDGKNSSTAQDSSDDCDEEDEDNEAPVGKTTVFSDDVNDGKPATLEVDGTREMNSVAAPDRPADLDDSARTRMESALKGDAGESGDKWEERGGQEGDEGESDTQQQRSGDASGDALSSSPEELKRFETAREEPEGGVESPTDIRTTEGEE